MSRPAIYSVFIVTLILIGACFILPILVTVKQAFVAQDGSFTWDYLMEVLNNPLYREGLWNSLRMAVGSTALSLLIAFPLAMLASRFEKYRSVYRPLACPSNPTRERTPLQRPGSPGLVVGGSLLRQAGEFVLRRRERLGPSIFGLQLRQDELGECVLLLRGQPGSLGKSLFEQLGHACQFIPASASRTRLGHHEIRL